MISLLACARLLRRMFDLNAETRLLEQEIPGCNGLGPASYGIPVSPAWLPEPVLRQRAAESRPTGPRT